ncbi:MAG TPA: glycoside hydrolase domain-containing protein, partial [Solirubrobacteraceae bacterium]
PPAPGNEPDLQVPWMYAFAGAPWGTQRELAEIRTLYRPTLDGLPGNDDLGGLSAFHVFNAMGFGPVTPGAPFHVVGSPVFSRVTLRPAGGGRTFRVEATGEGALAPYVTSASLNGVPLERSWFYERELARDGGVLRLRMGTRPDTTWATDPQDRPPSVTGSKLGAFGC